MQTREEKKRWSCRYFLAVLLLEKQSEYNKDERVKIMKWARLEGFSPFAAAKLIYDRREAHE